MSAPAAQAAFEEALGFTPDPFQRQAFDALDAGDSVLVAAPTGAGKTVVAEYAVARALDHGHKAFYTTPIKALSNQKYGDFVRRYGHRRVGLLTGDNAINGEADIVVMTTEVLRNMIYEGSSTLESLGVVVLDEVHYLQDPYRGAVWEEVIIHLHSDVRLVCLSATVSNAEEFGDWLRTVRGDTKVIIDEQRPVELQHLYGVTLRHAENVILMPTFVDDERGRRVPNPDAPAFDPVGPVRGRRRPEPGARAPRARGVAPRREEVVRELWDQAMLPAIYFIFSRAACDQAVDQCLADGLHLTDTHEREEIRRIAERRVGGLGDTDLNVLGYGRWLQGLEAGIAAHHAGMVPPMKEAVEEAFAAGLVKVVFATETLALGINMPARAVVIERLTKFTGERHQMLTPGEYTQLTGRAGRRGIDDVGYAVVLWNRFATFDQVASLASRRTYELTSSFRPTYNMAVNLVRRYEREEAHHLLNLSFAQYQADRGIVAVERQAEDLLQRLDQLRRRAECDRGDVEEYRSLQARVERAEAEGSSRGHLEQAVASLRPGDVIHAGGRVGPVVVIRRATGARGANHVTALSTRGKVVRLSATSFREAPKPLARVDLPSPFRPKSADFRRELVSRLRRAASNPSASAPARPRRRDDRAQAAVRDHPVRSCPELADHLRALEQVSRLDRQLRRLERTTERRTDTLARRFDHVLEILGRRGYVHVDDWDLSEQGALLSRIYSESDLLVAESIRLGLFDGLDPASLAALVSVFTYEFRGPEGAAPPAHWPTSAVAKRGKAVEELWEGLRADEAERNLPETKAPDPGLVDLVYLWAKGEDLEDVIGDDEMTGGDFVRNMKQLIDLLRQVADAVFEPETARAGRAAAEAVFRGVVEASSRVNA